MWIPESVHALEAAARAGSLYETPSFDGKKQLPGPQQNVSLAIDVAAMSTDGGVLLYGVGEDANKRLTVLAPFPLAGAADRVAQIVETSIMEPPHVGIHEYPIDKDPSVGYLHVLVPQSARAPHQVTVKGDLRFYGRGAKGNRVLTEGEIARLYARRVVWEQDRNELLEDAVRQSPFPNSESSVIGFARPVLPDPAIWDWAVAAAGDRDALQRELQAAARWPQTATEYDPCFGRSVLEWHQLGSDDLRLSTLQEQQRSEDPPVYALEASIRIDGSARLFSARATFEDQSTTVVRNVAMEFIIAGNFASFLNLVCKLYELAGYHGHVDVGTAVNGLSRAVSITTPPHVIRRASYNAADFRRTQRVAASELRDPRAIAARMFKPLFELTTGDADFNAFTWTRTQ